MLFWGGIIEMRDRVDRRFSCLPYVRFRRPVSSNCVVDHAWHGIIPLFSVCKTSIAMVERNIDNFRNRS
jgi:hypothetical protein